MLRGNDDDDDDTTTVVLPTREREASAADADIFFAAEREKRDKKRKKKGKNGTNFTRGESLLHFFYIARCEIIETDRRTRSSGRIVSLSLIL